MTRGRRGWTVVAATLTVLGGMATEAEGQWRGRDRHRGHQDRGRAERYEPRAAPAFGLSFLAADPQGEMGLLVDDGFGGQVFGSFPLDRAGHVRIRADLGFLIYGHERQRYCFSVPIGCRIEMDLTTTNSIAFGGVGPELVFATGGVQPYVNGSVGFSYFFTSSALSGDAEYEDHFTTTNYDDVVMAWRAGGGLRVRVSDGRKPVWLDMAVEHHENGTANYLTKGDIQDNPDGSITLFPTRSDANLLAFRFGVSIGIGRGRTR